VVNLFVDNPVIELDRPIYDPAAVQPMRQQLTEVGFKELLTPEEVERAVAGAENSTGTMLLVINSVCGCAAGSARPGLALALQNKLIPNRLTTVFAGMEKSATARAREFLAPNPSSSPSFALFKDGALVKMIHRREIEVRTADQVADLLVETFNQYCEAPGPSIPPEKFASLDMALLCGSTLPRFQN